MLGMHGAAFANYAVDDCDFLIALGARFDDRVAGNPAEVRAATRKRIAHLDIDRVRDQQGQARAAGATSACCAEALRALHARTAARSGFSATASRWHAHLARAQAALRDELRPRQRADPAVLRDRGDQPPHARRGDHHHRRRPASDVGRAVLRFPPRRACGSPPAAWARWASACRPRSARRSRNPEQARHRHRRRRAASA